MLRASRRTALALASSSSSLGHGDTPPAAKKFRSDDDGDRAVYVLTQQRGEAGGDGEAWEELFGRPIHPHRRFDLSFATLQLQEAGFEIERAEVADTPMDFRDLEGVVYYLRLVPWAVEDFASDVDGEALERIQQKLEEDGQLRICGSHMLIDGVKL